MSYPSNVGVIDTFMRIPDPGSDLFKSFRGALTDAAERSGDEAPIRYLFKQSMPDLAFGEATDQVIEVVLSEMDHHGIDRAMIAVSDTSEMAKAALSDHPERFFAELHVDPTQGIMDEVRRIERFHRDWGIKAVTSFPAGIRLPVGDRTWFPIYAKCAELSIPFVTPMGVPGPRLPYSPQDPAQLDELCYLFPDLTIVTRHGCEPWTELMVKLLLKWPNLYYSTSAFAPSHYPANIIEFANTRGAEKIIYAGYFPVGLTLERVFRELPDVGFRPEVWPKFLRENAIRVFKL